MGFKQRNQIMGTVEGWIFIALVTIACPTAAAAMVATAGLRWLFRKEGE